MEPLAWVGQYSGVLGVVGGFKVENFKFGSFLGGSVVLKSLLVFLSKIDDDKDWLLLSKQMLDVEAFSCSTNFNLQL